MTDNQKTCFSIMPFKPGFNDISSIIQQAAEQCGLSYVRGDHRNKPGSVMPKILDDIRQSAVVVADITGNNPNVFYELGIAHQIKGPDPVVIITQDGESPYDVNQFRQLKYEHTVAGRAELSERLPDCLEQALQFQTDKEIWSVIRGALERTRLIVRDLKRLVSDAKDGDLSDVTIRMVSGLGSLAISNLEPHDRTLGADYNTAMIEERNALREALVRGAQLKSMLHPPRFFTAGMVEERLDRRYKRLIGLLTGISDIENDDRQSEADLSAIKQSNFCITPVPMPHLFIIGTDVAYEGMKRGGERGYAMTHCETDPLSVQRFISDFDKHFMECGGVMTHADMADKLTAYLDEASPSSN